MKLESDALQTAAATFPCPIDVKAIDDWTVDGSTARNIRPALMSAETMRSGASAIPNAISGNTM